MPHTLHLFAPRFATGFDDLCFTALPALQILAMDHQSLLWYLHNRFVYALERNLRFMSILPSGFECELCGSFV